MKTTVHQRLRAQRRAEHSRAAWRAHRRAVRWFGCGGYRCPECCDIPLHRWEVRGMTIGEGLVAEDERQEMLAFQRLYRHEESMGLYAPESDDPKHWHLLHALGYWS